MSAIQSGSVESGVSPVVASSLRRRANSVELASSRAFASNPNHHLWKNGRLWWIAFTLIHDGWRQERIRQSLGTDSLQEARHRRDAILGLFVKEAESRPGTDPGGCCIDPEPELTQLTPHVGPTGVGPHKFQINGALSCC